MSRPSLRPAYVPSEEEVRSYERRGWLVTPRILPDELLEATRSAIDRYHLGQRDHRLPGGLEGARDGGFADWRPGDGDGVRNNEFCSLQCAGVRSLVHVPALGAIAGRLARARCIRLFDDQAVYKPAAPGEGPDPGATTGWHTDHSYWSTCTSERMLTVWIPLDDADEKSGALQVVDGSHRWPESEHVRGFNDFDLDNLGARIGRPVPPESVITMEVPKGAVSFHHMRLLHASPPVAAGRPRYAVAVHLQDGGNGHRPFVGPDGNEIVLPHDRLCRRDRAGFPDYADPEVFPVLWDGAAAPRHGEGTLLG